MKRPFQPDELRAAKLTRIPGITIAVAAARFQVPLARVKAARRDCREQTQVTLAELALAALTDNGLKRDFSLTEAGLAHLATWLDYINHDASKSDDVRRLLEQLAAAGTVALRADGGELLVPWP